MTLPRHINDLLETASVARLVRHAQHVRRATGILHGCVGEQAAGHCVVANVRADVLVIHTDTPAWAAKLRFQVAPLLKQFRQEPNFAGLRTIHIKSFPASHPGS
jgi:hypothetical protein